MRRLKRRVFMARQTHKGPIRFAAAFPGLLVSPELRGEDKHALKARGQNSRLWRHVHVVINLVLPIEVGNAARDRVLRIDEVKADFALVPLGRRPFGRVLGPNPCAALNFLGPFVLVSAHHAVVNHDQSAATSKELLEVSAIITGSLHAVRGEDYQHICVFKLLRGRKVHRPVSLDTALLEQRHPLLEEARVVVLARTMRFYSRADENAKLFSRLSQGERDGDVESQGESNRAFHFLSSVSSRLYSHFAFRQTKFFCRALGIPAGLTTVLFLHFGFANEDLSPCAALFTPGMVTARGHAPGSANAS